MNTFTRFLYEFLAQFFSGIRTIVGGLIKGIGQLANIKAYSDVVSNYKGDFTMPEWIMVAIAILVMILVYGMAILLVYFLIRKYIKFRRKLVEEESLLDEIAVLNNKIVSLMKEKDQILAMKVSQLGLKPGETDELENKPKAPEEEKGNTGIRFSKLNEIDQEFAMTIRNLNSREKLKETLLFYLSNMS